MLFGCCGAVFGRGLCLRRTGVVTLILRAISTGTFRFGLPSGGFPTSLTVGKLFSVNMESTFVGVFGVISSSN